MNDTQECDTPLRPITPDDRLLPHDGPATFVAQLRQILAGLLGR